MAHFGVPQERYRAVILASRTFEPLLPPLQLDRSEFKTVRNAIAHLSALDPNGGRDQEDEMHRTSMHRRETIEIIEQVPKDGGSRPRGIGPGCLDRVQGFSDVYGRLAWDKPAITITARCRTPSCGRFTHPEQNRGLSIREAALLQGFPHSFRFEGPFDDCYKQIGNAVPPLFSLALANHLREMLSGRKASGRLGPLSMESPQFKSYSILIAHHKTGSKSHANRHE
jgi:DNA (cytosine-5)-methyltransferase 1